jgi:hypothetical protein
MPKLNRRQEKTGFSRLGFSDLSMIRENRPAGSLHLRVNGGPDGSTRRFFPYTEHMRHLSRRTLLGSAPAAIAANSLSAQTSAAPKRRQRFAVSTYSYWHLRGERYPIEKVIDHAAELGFEGVEILHRQMSGESAAYLNSLKRQAFNRGLDLVMLSIHQGFVFPDKGRAAQERRAHRALH